MGLTFAELMTQESVATVRARLAAALLADGFPVSSWAPSAAGGVENMRLDVSAGAGAFLPPRIVAMVTGRILPLATDTPENGNWLSYLGLKFYGLTKRLATRTIENIALYALGTPGSYTFNPLDLWARSDATGNRYQSITGGKFSAANTGPPTPTFPGNPLMLQYQAENPGSSYADAAGTITTMVTARAGVRCVNIAPADFTAASVNGPSSGTVAAKFTVPGIAPTFGSIRVAIERSGDVSSAGFSFSTDGGRTWSPIFLLSATFVIAGGATLTFASSDVSPSFLAGDTFTMFLGDPILQRGTDAETDIAFRRRCSNRWPSLSDVPVGATIDLWAHNASSEVEKVSVVADPNVSGGVLVTIASATGPASPAAQIAVEDYIAPRLLGYKGVPAPATAGFTSPAETVIVSSAVAFAVTVKGPVRVPKALIGPAQIAANVAWNAYLASLPLGGQPGAVIELARLAQILADAGGIDIPTLLSGLQINGASADLAIPTGQVAVPAAGKTLLNSITWIPA